MKKIRKYGTIFGCIILILSFSFSFQRNCAEWTRIDGSLVHFASFISHSPEYINPNPERVHLQNFPSGKILIDNPSSWNPVVNNKQFNLSGLPFRAVVISNASLSRICKLQI